MAMSSPDEVLSILLDVDVKGVEKLESSMGKWNQALNAGMGAAKAFIGTLAAIDVAIVGFGVAASQKAASFDALVMSLNAVEGSAKKAERSIAALREIAKGPGLGVESAIETYSGLRRGGLESGFAMDFTKNLGNAIAFTGGGKEELGRIAIALNQIAISPTLRGQDVMQLAQARLPVYNALKSAFGTGDTAELDKMGVSSADALKAINAELAKLPKVAGGAKNTFENLTDALNYGMVQIGQGINAGIMPYVMDFIGAIEKVSEDGSLKDFGSALAETFTTVLDSISGSGATAQEVIDDAMRGMLTLSYASRNFIMQLGNLWEIFKALVPGADIIGGKGVSGISPLEEANFTMDAIVKGRADRKLAAEIRGKKGDGLTDPEVETPATEAPAVKFLREIEKHTKTMADRIEDALLGGGVATDAAFNVRNIGAWSGASGGNRAEKMIIEGFRLLQSEAGVAMARSGTFGRRNG